MTDTTRILEPFIEGWAGYQRLLLDAIGPPRRQAALLPDGAVPVGGLAARHMAGSRAYWFHDILGEGDATVREMFRAEATTVPDLPLEDAGWEDDERHPRTAGELTRGVRAGVGDDRRVPPPMDGR